MAHDLREEIYETIREKPGLNKNQLANHLDIYVNQLNYHVDRLVQNGLVEEVRGGQGREVLLFHPEQKELWEDPQTRVLFGRTPVREVGLFVADNSGTTSGAIAEATGRTPATVRHHLRTLRQHELAEAIQVGTATHYHSTDRLDRWADMVGDRYERPWSTDVQP